MYIVKEVSLSNFDAWSGAVDALNWLNGNLSSDELDTVEEAIVDYIADEHGVIEETALNDFLWFEGDSIANILGYENWDRMVAAYEGEEEDDDEDDEDEEDDTTED